MVALFRRLEALSDTESNTKDTTITQQALTLDLNRLQTLWRGAPIDTTLTEFWILYALAQRPGHVKTRQQLMDAANVVLDEQTITSHIKRLRKKFQQQDPTFDSIQTVYGAGYRWLQ